MRSIEDKGCLGYNYNNNGIATQQQQQQQQQEISGSSCMSFEFHKSNGLTTLTRTPSHHHRTPLGKPTPSKWDDAQKWLVNLSRGEKNQAKASPRNSNADDRRLIVAVPKRDYSSGEDDGCPASNGVVDLEMETKNVVGEEADTAAAAEEEEEEDSIWRINKHVKSSKSAMVRSICVRDTGTEMTPIASQEPSRTATPIRATTPAARSPITSGTSTPVRCPDGVMAMAPGSGNCSGNGAVAMPPVQFDRANGETKTCNDALPGKVNTLESRALAWDEAERAKYMARYKREEVKIQAWENHQKRKAEMEMRKMEVKAERMKSRAQEKCTNKVAAARRLAEEKRANAEAKLNEKGVKTSERADYIRRTGHLPSSFSFSFKLPSFCW